VTEEAGFLPIQLLKGLLLLTHPEVRVFAEEMEKRRVQLCRGCGQVKEVGHTGRCTAAKELKLRRKTVQTERRLNMDATQE
jgi:hypothetical protein